MKTGASSILLFFGLFWSALTLLFDGFTLIPAARQIFALNYPSVEGTMVSSEVTTADGDEGGTVYGVAVSYSYNVGGQEYAGHLYHYDTGKSSDSAWAQRIVAEHPPGAEVRVYYNPARPQDAVLAAGVEGSDLFMLAFMTPFNGVMLGFWRAGLARLAKRWIKPPAGGVKLIGEPRKIRARLTPWSALTVALFTLALLAFLSIFVVGFLGGGFHPSLHTMMVTCSVIVGGAILAGVCYEAKILSGKYDLVIDELGSTLELPLTHGRKMRRRIPFSSVQSVCVETVQKTANNNEQTSPMYAPTLCLQGAEPASEKLVEWHDEQKAAQFAEWLRKKLPAKPIPPRSLAGKF